VVTIRNVGYDAIQACLTGDKSISLINRKSKEFSWCFLVKSVYDNESALSERDGLTIAEFEPNRSGVLSFPEFVCDHHISTGLDGLALRVVNDMLGS